MRLQKAAMLFSLFAFCFLTIGGVTIRAYVQQPSLITLKSTERIFAGRGNLKSIAIFPQNQKLYAVNEHGAAISDDKNGALSEPLSGQIKGEIAFGPQGHLYSLESRFRLRVVNSSGIVLATFPVPEAYSLGVLKQGNIVVAAPSNGHLFQIYNQTGRPLGSFGEIKSFDTVNAEQNVFLNIGKILIGPSDEIYYVYKYAPIVQKYSSKGEFISEFRVEGDAISRQQETMKSFLNQKALELVGGIHIINSADIDPQTGNLWFCMNGSSLSGVVYEYNTTGAKLREYAFVFDAPSNPLIITDVMSIVVRNRSIYLLASDGLAYRFQIDNRLTSSLIPSLNRIIEKNGWSLALKAFLSPALRSLAYSLPLQCPCPTEQTVPDCTVNCSPNDTVNCKTELVASIAAGLRKIQPVGCNVNNNQCTANATACGSMPTCARTTHSITLNCPGTGGGNASGEGFGGGGPNSECPIEAPTNCSDSFDNDHDGDTDLADSECYCGSPIVLDILGDGIDLTDASNGVLFDLAGIGRPLRMAWTQGDDSWLALDRNGNGLIDNGTELFGDFSPQPRSAAANGFLALAEFDKTGNGGNGDGQVDNRDTIFSSLRLWQDTNHNGISEAVEIHTLPEFGVTSFDLDYKESKRVDEHGNRFKYRARVKDVNGAQVGRWAWDVFLMKAQ
jgi:hypothetical protein